MIVAAQRRLGGYDHSNRYDHGCCGSTTAAIAALAMVTISAAMATIAEPMGVLQRPSSPPRPLDPGHPRGEGGRSKTPIGSAIVAMAAAIVNIATVVMAAVGEPQQSWS